jgi:hypothetical protein
MCVCVHREREGCGRKQEEEQTTTATITSPLECVASLSSLPLVMRILESRGLYSTCSSSGTTVTTTVAAMQQFRHRFVALVARVVLAVLFVG